MERHVDRKRRTCPTFLFAASLGLLVIANTARTQPVQRFKVGQVIIIGNTTAEDRVIRDAAGLWPGQVVSQNELRLARENIRRLGLFRFDASNGNGPSVVALEPDNSGYRDILVEVKELPQKAEWDRLALCLLGVAVLAAFAPVCVFSLRRRG